MNMFLRSIVIAGALVGTVAMTPAADAAGKYDSGRGNADAGAPRAGGKWSRNKDKVQLGPRPYYLVDQMTEGRLKRKLQQCANREFTKSKFSIAHRGAPLQFPEHTEEGYRAAARMGAGIIECDVSFTKDAELVCRHSQCDLHQTTNILETPLASTCEVGFRPAEFDANGNRIKSATAKCCTSGLTLAEFKSLKGKMDGRNTSATTVEEYMAGTSNWRTDLYSTGGTLMSHKESIELFKELGVEMTPELKGVDGAVGFGDSGLTLETYAAKMIQDYIDAGVSPKKVWPQSFGYEAIEYWLDEYPAYGRQAVFLDSPADALSGNTPPSVADFEALYDQGLRVIAVAMQNFVTLDANNNIVPSDYAKNAKAAGLKLIAWTTERSGRIVEDVLPGSGGYYRTTLDGLSNDGDIMTTIDVLARDVGLIGLFSDWPATTTYYANCMGKK